MNAFNPRAMGFMESVTTLIGHDQMVGSLSCSAMLTVSGVVDFDAFKAAWEAVFAQQPMLRATRSINDGTCFFDFDADFADIPISYFEVTDFAEVENEYSRNILKPFDLNRYFWRASLMVDSSKSLSYLIFAAPHSIVDGISISWLFGGLLRAMVALQNGKEPNRQSFPVPKAIDDVLDRTQFSEPEQETETMPLPEPMMFECHTDSNTAQSHNIFRVLKKSQLSNLLSLCKQNKVTLTGVLSAALALSTFDVTGNSDGYFDLMIAFELRKYTQPMLANEVLAFYAHQVLCGAKVDAEKSFWALAGEFQKSYQKAIKEYSIPDLTPDVLQMIGQRWQDCLDKQQFLRAYSISNLGVIDTALHGTEKMFPAQSFHFTISQQALANGMIIFAASLNGQLHLDFNFATPAFNPEKANQIADRFTQILTTASHTHAK